MDFKPKQTKAIIGKTEKTKADMWGFLIVVTATKALKMGAFCVEVDSLARFYAKKKRGHMSGPAKV